MQRPTILVSGATGKTGSAIVKQLLQKSWPVKAVVRIRDARSARLAQLGAHTVVADLFDPDQLRQAMQLLSALSSLHDPERGGVCGGGA
jgi:uncharacterized protein YbjT (DUF2867 family)